MGKLYKLDLEPNEIYNVSLNIKQGDKTVDNLRFFQTRVPKLYNIQTSNFTPFSQIIEKSDPAVRTEFGGGLKKDKGSGADVEVSLKKISWTRYIEKYERSEGETVIDPSSVEYTFTLTFDAEPKLIGYFVSGFTGRLSFLNYRTNYQRVEGKGNEKKLQVKVTLLDIDPTVTRTLVTNNNNKFLEGRLVTDILVAGSTTSLIFDKELKGIVLGKSKGKLARKGGPPTAYYWNNATIIGYQKLPGSPARWYVQFDKPSALKALAGDISNRFDWKTPTSEITFSGGDYSWLGESNSAASKEADISKAKITYQTIATYSVKDPTVKYKFAKTSYINSAVLNPNIIDKLIWEDDVRDYIYFIIQDIDGAGGNKKMYFFGTYGAIDASNEEESIVGDSEYNSSKPPLAHIAITGNSKLFKSSTGNVKYYAASAEQTNDPSVPDLVRNIKVYFAVARYVKNKNNTWEGKWMSPSSPLSGAESL
jgi:hypothetical protein